MTKELKTQWHPAFCSAVKLELGNDCEYLEYTDEFNLNSKPLQIDLLIVKKSKYVQMENQIGRIFRGHNILEYKSPEDSMNVDTFIKVVGYACLYKANEKYVDEISLDDITLTLIRESYPRKLFLWFEENGYHIEEKYPGIYYVTKKWNFPIQILVSGRMSKNSQKWLTLLSSNLRKEDIQRAFLQVDELKRKDEKEYAESVLEVAYVENAHMFQNTKKEGESMAGFFREFFAPELEAAKEKIRQEVQREVRQEIQQEVRQEVRQEVQQEMRQEYNKSILYALGKGRTAEEIADFTGIPLEEVKTVEKEFLKNEK